MKSSVMLAAGLAAVAQAAYYGNETAVYTTYTTDILTTVCPSATTLTYGTHTYTATASETLTITGKLRPRTCQKASLLTLFLP